jgi:hypothetical protein
VQNQEKTTGDLTDKTPVEQYSEAFNTTLKFQADLIHLLGSLSALEYHGTDTPQQSALPSSADVPIENQLRD